VGPTLSFETTWLREYAKNILPSEATIEFDPHQFGEAAVDLLDLTCLFRRGRVVYSDKVDASGTIWVVVGTDCDGMAMRAVLDVHTQEMRVSVTKLERLSGDRGYDNDAA
jgi:hypothetical protein